MIDAYMDEPAPRGAGSCASAATISRTPPPIARRGGAVRAFGPAKALAAAFDLEVAAERGIRATLVTAAGVLATAPADTHGADASAARADDRVRRGCRVPARHGRECPQGDCAGLGSRTTTGITRPPVRAW